MERIFYVAHIRKQNRSASRRRRFVQYDSVDALYGRLGRYVCERRHRIFADIYFVPVPLRTGDRRSYERCDQRLTGKGFIVMIYVSTEKISAALLQGENPLPHFRSREHDMRVEFCTGTPPFCLSGAGFSCGYRILPYTVQDRYDRNRKECDIRTIVMENDFIKAEFLPDWGGRLWSLVDKTSGRELLYKNGVLQPANLAIRNAWFSGGVEWNVGQYGHAFTTCSTVGFASVRASDGEEFLRMYSYERCKDFFWQIDFHLPESSRFLYAHPVIFNINHEPLSVYYWTNIAVPQTDSSRVFASSRHALYKTPDDQNGRPTFGYGRMPFFPIAPDIDLSYPARIPFSSEYFFNCTDESHPWEAALEKDGAGLFDVSTGELSYRKMFCWGNCRGGGQWGSFLAVAWRTRRRRGKCRLPLL